MKDKKWLINSFALGFVFFLALFIIKPVGVSTQFSVVGGIIHNMIDSDVITKDTSRESGYRSTNAYYDKNEGKLAKSIKNPWNYDFVFVLSIPLGAYLGYILNKKKRKSAMPGPTNKEIKNSNLTNKTFKIFRLYAPSFISGFLLLYGARMADGCTSGHMMSGMMQGSVSGYIFAASVFLVAIPTALLIKHLKSRKRGV